MSAEAIENRDQMQVDLAKSLDDNNPSTQENPKAPASENDI